VPVKISVAMCTYNGAAFVAEQLDSIARQTRVPDELVICDDRSTDDTLELVRDWSRHAQFDVRVEQNAERLGTIRNFDRAVGMCGGELIALSDQDDFWLPQKLGVVEARFLSDPGLGALFSDAELVDESLRPLGRRLWQSVGFDEREQRLLQQGHSESVLMKSFVTGATLTFRKGIATLSRPFPTDLPMFIHDGWIALLALAVSRVDFVNEPLILYRQHDAQQIGARPGRDVLTKRISRQIKRDGSILQDELKAMHRLRQRLQEQKIFPVRKVFKAALDDRIAFLDSRACLPSSRLRRIPTIMRNLRLGHYRRFANGSLSALKDLAA